MVKVSSLLRTEKGLLKLCNKKFLKASFRDVFLWKVHCSCTVRLRRINWAEIYIRWLGIISDVGWGRYTGNVTDDKLRPVEVKNYAKRPILAFLASLYPLHIKSRRSQSVKELYDQFCEFQNFYNHFLKPTKES